MCNVLRVTHCPLRGRETSSPSPYTYIHTLTQDRTLNIRVSSTQPSEPPPSANTKATGGSGFILILPAQKMKQQKYLKKSSYLIQFCLDAGERKSKAQGELLIFDL